MCDDSDSSLEISSRVSWGFSPPHSLVGMEAPYTGPQGVVLIYMLKAGSPLCQ